MFVHVKALESWLRAAGSLPVNVKCVFEGEEEIGSPNLRDFLAENEDAWKADAAIMSDMRMLGPGRPAITESLRGALSVDLELRGQQQDLHSGNFGGAIHNPLQALCEIIARLHNADGTIAIPRFYERVRALTPAERAYMARVGPSDAEILRDAGAARGWGEPGFSLYERIAIRPSLSVNGMIGGYTGPGAKAVIPARAAAKLNFRLVPEQDPAEIDALLRGFIARDRAANRRCQHPDVVPRPSLRAAPRPSRGARRARSTAQGIRGAARFLAQRRNDSGRASTAGGAGHSHRADGFRPAR